MQEMSALIPFSERYSGEFLSRKEENFDLLLQKIQTFYEATRPGIQDGDTSRRKLEGRFDYKEEVGSPTFNEEGLSTQEVAEEFADMMSGVIRHQDPITAFNIIPTPLFDTLAAVTLANLCNPNTCWDFISGKLCAYEKKITRILGNMAGWPEADGFVVTGGKQALSYAIKSGMERANAQSPGKMEDNFVVCSELAHYSIEHVCHFLGASSTNCLRVAAYPSGEINLDALKQQLKQTVAQGKKIAAVIAVGGATVNLVLDPIAEMKRVIDEVVTECNLDYIPYLHADTVITWTWLAFESSKEPLEDQQAHPNSIQKVKNVMRKLLGVSRADSFAADFHKTAFCPYPAGVFVTKDPKSLYRMVPGSYTPPETPLFGDIEPFRQTFENSRPSISIVSTWTAIRKMGLRGLRDFVLYQLDVCESFKQKIREQQAEHFEVLNEHSNGWEIVIKPYFQNHLSWDALQEATDEEQEAYRNTCHTFSKYLWFAPIMQESLEHPVIGFIPHYSKKGSHEKKLPAFLIHPTSLHYNDETINEMIQKILGTKSAFDSLSPEEASSFAREESYVVTPPK